MENLKIAVIGAGTAGLAGAAFLHQTGNKVVLFEKFDSPRPIGAGLLIQPTGLSVLAKLGLDKDIIKAGSIVNRLHGKNAGGKLTALHVAYKDFAPHLFGVGTHRGVLFSKLYSKVTELGIEVRPSSEIIDVVTENNSCTLISAAGQRFEGFDLVIDSSGQRSDLRKKYADIKLDKLYPYGAVWAVVEVKSDKFRPDCLEQRFKKARHMIGVLPVGKEEGKEVTRAAFFWSMRIKDYDKWKQQDFNEWKDYVTKLWPDTACLLAQFNSHNDLMRAEYRDVVLRKYHNGRLVFIGDSAHCTSPQLGQGANLALVDAMVLSECINTHDNIEEALETYTKRRKKHLNFYQTASRILTRFFQSDSFIYPLLRPIFCGIPCHMGFSKRIAAQVLSGTRTGLFSYLNPGDWCKDYDLKK